VTPLFQETELNIEIVLQAMPKDIVRFVDENLEDPTIAYRERCLFCAEFAEQGKKLMLCSVCQKAKYCGRDCQKLDWPLHKHSH